MSRTKKLNTNLNRIKKLDPIYSSPTVQMILQRIIKNGKKKLAFRIIQKIFKNIEKKTKSDPFSTIETAIRNTTPSVHIQTRRLGGSVHSIPVTLNPEIGTLRAIGWIVNSAKTRPGYNFDIKLANEFIDASKKQGNAFHKKEEIHKIAEKNSRSTYKK